MRSLARLLRVLAALVLGVGAMVLLMVWLAGGFRTKVAPAPPAALPPAAAGLEVRTAEAVEVPLYRESVGAVAAEHEITVASMLLGRVVSVKASAGQKVDEGEVLVRLEDAEQRARLAQAAAALADAEDERARVERLRAGGAVSEQTLTQAAIAVEAAEARLAEAETVLGYTVIRAPRTGVVIDRFCEVGDTVQPGSVLVRLYDRLQLVATVPESLQAHLALGQKLPVRLDAIGQTCMGDIAEIVPQSSLARAFDVKVTGPCEGGVMPGMFGRLRIPVGTRREVRVPLSAVRRIGQITMVIRVTADGGLVRQFVRLGEAHQDEATVTSGLEPGTRYLADHRDATAEPRP